MFAWFLVALVALTAVAALGVLADSGLRWWSAFGQLRHRLKLPTEIEKCESGMRPTITHGGFTRPGRTRPVTRQTVRCAA